MVDSSVLSNGFTSLVWASPQSRKENGFVQSVHRIGKRSNTEYAETRNLQEAFSDNHGHGLKKCNWRSLGKRTATSVY